MTDSSMTEQYDPTKVVLTFEGKVITGFAEGGPLKHNPFKITIDEDTSGVTHVILNGVKFIKEDSEGQEVIY